jgi:hypothetical protein
MANTEAPQPRRRKSGMNWIPAGVALVTVALFIGWLATRQPQAGVAVTEPDAAGEATDDAEGAGPATVIDPAQLAGATVRDLVGQDVELTSVPITSVLGPQLFWIELPGGSPFLVKLNQNLVDRGTQVQAGRNARIVGRIQDKDDAVLAEWEQAGVLRSESDRLQAEYGNTYIEARQIQPAG